MVPNVLFGSSSSLGCPLRKNDRDAMFMVAFMIPLEIEEVWLLLLEEDNIVDSCLLVFLTIDDE